MCLCNLVFARKAVGDFYHRFPVDSCHKLRSAPSILNQIILTLGLYVHRHALTIVAGSAVSSVAMRSRPFIYTAYN